jgi:hypothetical protein
MFTAGQINSFELGKKIAENKAMGNIDKINGKEITFGERLLMADKKADSMMDNKEFEGLRSIAKNLLDVGYTSHKLRQMAEIDENELNNLCESSDPAVIIKLMERM